MLGLPSLKAFLESNNHEVKIIDIAIEMYTKERPLYDLCQELVPKYYFTDDLVQILFLEYFKEKNLNPLHEKVRSKLEPFIKKTASVILNESPNYIGMTSYHCTHLFSLLLAQEIKHQTKNMPIIFGGPELFQNPTFLGFCLASNLVDIAVIGEGELTLLEIAEKIYKGEKILGIKGTAFLNPSTNRVEYSEQRPLIQDLNKLPYPDFSDLPLSDYPPIFGVSPVLPIAASRGCPFKCVFCAERAFWRTFRQKRVENIIKEFRYYKDEYGGKLFYMTDSLINANLSWLEKFCDYLIKEKLDVYWMVYSRISPMKLELLPKMAKAGCVVLDLGIEHSSQKILAYMNKGIKREDILPFLKKAHKEGICVWTDWIVGFPGEDEKDYYDLISTVMIGSNYFHAALDNKFLVLGGSSVYSNKNNFDLETIRYLTIKLPPELNRLKEFVKKEMIIPKHPSGMEADLRRNILRRLADTRLTPFLYKECPSVFKRLYKELLTPETRVALNHDPEVSSDLVPVTGEKCERHVYGVLMYKSWLNYDCLPFIELDEEGYIIVKECDSEKPPTLSQLAEKIRKLYPEKYLSLSEEEMIEKIIDFISFFLFNSFMYIKNE